MPVTCIRGPRQAGKTTLAKQCFPTYKYFLCDREATANSINADPEAFIADNLATAPGIIIDEFQLCPRILPAIKIYVDETGSQGQIILTGSQNYLMMANVTESLAGRVVLFTILPPSINELKQSKILPDNIDELMFKGSFPRLHADTNLSTEQFYLDYIDTYIQRDIKTLQKLPDEAQFLKFLKLCAGRCGQVLNVNTLAADAKIDVKTANQWLSLLSSCYIIYTLSPHYENFNKQLTKSPKLYFTDTGIICSLLGINSPEALANHKIRGALFENFVITESSKWYYTSSSTRPALYFWCDEQKHEIDLIVDLAGTLVPLEIKSANVARNNMTDVISFWHDLTGHPLDQSYVIYTGPDAISPTGPHFISWQNIPELFTKFYAPTKKKSPHSDE